MQTQPVKAALIGAGQRGYENFGAYALHHPDEFQFTAVCDIDRLKLKMFSEKHNIADKFQFTDFRELFKTKGLFDAVFIATMDRAHLEPALLAIKNKYPVFLEKPMAHTLEASIRIVEEAEKNNVLLQIAHPLRYTPIMTELKKIVDSGRIGRILSMIHNENVGNIHFSHSFVRGNWGNSQKSTPMIVQKSCHDMDLIVWLLDKQPKKLISFGSLSYFNKKHQPPKATDRCLEGCPYEDECPYSVKKIYLTDYTAWPVSVISVDASYEGRYKALETGPYGRCVFACDNDVPDHQVVLIEFEDDITVSFQMVGTTFRESRTMKIMGTQGEIRLSTAENEIEVSTFSPRKTEIIHPELQGGSHLGGDERLLKGFYKALTEKKKSLTTGRSSLLGHVLAFKAEESRLTGSIVNL